MAHDTSQADSEGVVPRGVRGSDGRPDAVDSDAPQLGNGTSREVDHGHQSVDEDHDTVQEEFFEVARSFTGPIPPVPELAGYDGLVPGSAKGIIDAHLYSEKARADALTRLTTAESRAVSVGAIGAQVLTIGGLISAVALIVTGYDAGVIVLIPSVLAAAAQVVAAVRGKRDS